MITRSQHPTFSRRSTGRVTAPRVERAPVGGPCQIVLVSARIAICRPGRASMRKIKKFNPMSVMRLAAICYGALGLFEGILFAMVFLVVGLSGQDAMPGMPRFLAPLFGVVLHCLLPDSVRGVRSDWGRPRSGHLQCRSPLRGRYRSRSGIAFRSRSYQLAARREVLSGVRVSGICVHLCLSVV